MTDRGRFRNDDAHDRQDAQDLRAARDVLDSRVEVQGNVLDARLKELEDTFLLPPCSPNVPRVASFHSPAPGPKVDKARRREARHRYWLLRTTRGSALAPSVAVIGFGIGVIALAGGLLFGYEIFANVFGTTFTAGLLVAGLVLSLYIAGAGAILIRFPTVLRVLNSRTFPMAISEDERLVDADDVPGGQWLVEFRVKGAMGTTSDRGVLWIEGDRLMFSGHRCSWAVGAKEIDDLVPRLGLIHLRRRRLPNFRGRLILLQTPERAPEYQRLVSLLRLWHTAAQPVEESWLPPLTEYGQPPYYINYA